jgi:hypothetical protein
MNFMDHQGVQSTERLHRATTDTAIDALERGEGFPSFNYCSDRAPLTPTLSPAGRGSHTERVARASNLIRICAGSGRHHRAAQMRKLPMGNGVPALKASRVLFKYRRKNWQRNARCS